MATNLLTAQEYLLQQLEPLRAKHNIPILEMSDKAFNSVVTASALYLGFLEITNANSNTFNRGYAKNVQFQILIRLQNLRSDSTAFPIMASVEEALVGKKPIANCKEIEIGEQRFLTDFAVNGLWFYSIIFGFQIYE